MSSFSLTTLTELYRTAAREFAGRPAFGTKEGKTFRFLTYDALYEQGIALATALHEIGLRPRENVALFADNREEWMVSDYGILLAGAADVPRGADITESEMTYITTHAHTEIIFIENLRLLKRLQPIVSGLPHVRHMILMDRHESPPEGVLSLEALIQRGRQLRKEGNREVEAVVSQVRPEDTFTIIYTSGTTGTPKGVPLTHANMASQIRNLPFGLTREDRVLSILPVWHSYERVFEMVTIAHGATTYYTNIRAIAEDLQLVRPTIMASAPRLWENLYLKILDRVKSGSPVKRLLFHLAYCSARSLRRAQLFFKGQELDLTGRGLQERGRLAFAHAISALFAFLPYKLLDSLVLAKLRQVVGGEFRGTISGGGALPLHVDEFFNFIGIPVLEGYGLTETSPVLAVRTWNNLVIGTVGRMFPETDVRICDLHTGEVLYASTSRGPKQVGAKGEIVVRGPQIMEGYYKDPERTKNVLHDGWLRTGDIGMVTFNQCLRVVGRCKDTIVLSNGENVEPVPIEGKLCDSPLISQCMIVGQDEKFLGALIVPDREGFLAAGISGDVMESKEAARMVDREIRRLINAENGFKPFERIAAWRWVSKPFEVGDELTPTYKIKRHVVAEKYASRIAEIFV